jgi:TRAP-type C4-dicarboxylate transport system substrate-binding protein
MASIQVAPFMGAIIMNQRAWRSIPEKHRELLMGITRRMEAELDASVQAFEAELIKNFSEYGLVINQVSPEQAQLWYADIDQAMPSLIKNVFDEGMYNRINVRLRAYRGGR